jgi:hypothetical protein
MTTVGSTVGAKGRVIASATPYPWPYHGSFDPRRSALVMIVDSRWRLDGEVADAADNRLTKIAQRLHAAGGLVVAVDLCPPRSLGGALTLPTASSPKAKHWITIDVTISAGGTSAFFSSVLDSTLRRAGCRDLVLAGWGLEGPVHSTLRDANDRGYECVLVPDASTSLATGLAGPACSMVEFSGGIFGAVALTTDLLEIL